MTTVHTNNEPTFEAPLVRGKSLAPTASAAAMAMAEAAKATVQARYLVAMQNPRDWNEVRHKILKACDRPRFAKTARYKKPVGGSKIEGFSIRFAEEVIRAVTNLLPETLIISEDDNERVLSVGLTDLEANISYMKQITVSKTVERSSTKEGQKILGTRINSYGKPVYLVSATDDEMLTKQNALESKTLRNHALRLVPSDILEEAVDAVSQAIEKEDARDPDAARKEILDGFAKLNITPKMLAAVLEGQPIDTLSPKQLGELREMWVAIRDGETTWAEISKDVVAKAEAGKTEPGAPPKTVEDLVSRGKNKKGAAAGKKPDTQPAPAAETKPATEPPKTEQKSEEKPKCPACGSVDGKHVPNCPEAGE